MTMSFTRRELVEWLIRGGLTVEARTNGDWCDILSSDLVGGDDDG